MKKIVFLIVAVMLIAFVTAAHAENKEGAFSITPFIGGYFFEGNQDYKDGITGGLRAGYNFTENLGVELFGTALYSEYKESNGANRVYFAGIEGLYHFMPEGPFVPFVAVGVGAIHYSSTDAELLPSKFAVDYGVGAKYFITDNIALRADVRHVLPLGDESIKYGNNPGFVHNDLLATLGITFDFGGEKKVVEEVKVEEPPAPVEVIEDSDKDGVVNNNDRCPNTPSGVAVDKAGCPEDTDKDGVADYIDKCPHTPEGVSVDKDGCIPDADKDGVPDYLDKCPGTPAGISVDKDGCPEDSDKDGVVNNLDKCPDTPAGTVVDKDGCNVCEKTSIRLDGVKFDTAKAVIKKKYDGGIKKVADFMKANPTATAVIEGHTDNVDIHNEPERNMRLSQARADSVRQYLINNLGIDGARITAVGYGPKKPIASNATAEGKKKNRRVEAIIETCSNTSAVPAAPVINKETGVSEKTTIRLEVKFATAKSDIKKKYHNDIKRVADFMKAHPGAATVIEGHTDDVDRHNEPERNMRLSQARADSVRQYLIDNFGIDASLVTAVGYGPKKPIASNATEAGKKKNRRVEAVIETIQTK